MNEQRTIMDTYSKIQREDIQWDVQWLLNNLFAKLRTTSNDAYVYGSIRQGIYDKWYTAAPDQQAKKAFKEAFNLASELDFLPPLVVDGRGNNNDSPVVVAEKRTRNDDEASSFADAPTKKPRGDDGKTPAESITMDVSAAAVSSVSSSSSSMTNNQAVRVNLVNKEDAGMKKYDIPSNEDRKRAAAPKIGETAAAHKTSSYEETQSRQQPPSQQPPTWGAEQRGPRAQVQFDDAISYVATIKRRFANDPSTYQAFLEILRSYKTGQRETKDVCEKLVPLFQDHPDLLKGFTFFLPDAFQDQAKERLHRAAADSEARQAAKRAQLEKANKAKDKSQDKEVETAQQVAAAGNDERGKKRTASDQAKDSLIPVALPSQHAKLKEALEKCNSDLRNALKMLRDPKNNLFCPPSLREEWCGELTETLNKSPPYVIIGCLGGTGVGKSSLLNALLNEADILPTSGSRGCTAAVVELRYNHDFMEPSDQTTVYKANIQFITMEDWRADVMLLLDDCCLEGTEQISSDTRHENEEANVAWATINSVYGDGTMESYDGSDKLTVFNELIQDNRIIELLQGKNGEPNKIVIEEGKVDATKAKQVLDHFCDPRNKRNRKLVREMKSLSKKFREQINDSVYRKGNGKEPQTWPLIRRVVIHGPWEVLSTGACLVDMPGVRDANAARAKVAEKYLQYCHKIWITAPIKRAVDDKTAKDLLGEEFRRRMLMDGQYGNISFICTHSDDCEVSEIMQDHEDVAKSKIGRWEEMVSRRDRSLELDKVKDDLQQKKDDLVIQTEEVQEEIMEIESEIEECMADEDSDDTMSGEDQESNSTLEGMKKSLAAKKTNERDLKAAISALEKSFYDIDMEWRQNQQKLKAKAAMVRIEFSTKSLQADFQKGLDEITRVRDEDQGNSPSHEKKRHTKSPLPEGFQLEVFCTASNEYLKLQKIKAGSDGPAACFDCPNDTQITDVMDSVHKTTSDFLNVHTENKIRGSRDVLDRIYLCATAGQQDSQAAQKCRQVFDAKVKEIEKAVNPISAEFCLQMGQMIASELHPSLKRAALKGNEKAMRIVRSWESSNTRTKLQRGPKANGLHHKTYSAAMKRHGVFKSQTAGPINLNQELVDPLEKEFSAQWQRTMDAGIKKLLGDAEKKLLDCYARSTKTLAESLEVSKMSSERAAALGKAASVSCETAIKEEFIKIYRKQTEKQRSLNRYLLGKMAKKMAPSYKAASKVPDGKGKFSRQTDALKKKAKIALSNKFEPMIKKLLQNVDLMKNELSAAIRETFGVVEQRLRGVYSVCWSDHEYLEALRDPIKRHEVRLSRNRLLPEIVGLLEKNEAVMDSLGIAHKDFEYNLVGFETQEDRLAKKMVEAQENGLFVDLIDHDNESVNDSKKPACKQGDNVKVSAASAPVTVKREPRATELPPVCPGPIPRKAAFPKMVRPVATSAHQSRQPRAHRKPRQEVSATTTGLQHLQSNSKSPTLAQNPPSPSPRQTFDGTHLTAHSPPLPIWVLQGRTEHMAYLLGHHSNGWKLIRWASNSKKQWIDPEQQTRYDQGGLRSSARQNGPAGPAR